MYWVKRGGKTGGEAAERVDGNNVRSLGGEKRATTVFQLVLAWNAEGRCHRQ